MNFILNTFLQIVVMPTLLWIVPVAHAHLRHDHDYELFTQKMREREQKTISYISPPSQCLVMILT